MGRSVASGVECLSDFREVNGRRKQRIPIYREIPFVIVIVFLVLYAPVWRLLTAVAIYCFQLIAF